MYIMNFIETSNEENRRYRNINKSLSNMLSQLVKENESLSNDSCP